MAASSPSSASCAQLVEADQSQKEHSKFSPQLQDPPNPYPPPVPTVTRTLRSADSRGPGHHPPLRKNSHHQHHTTTNPIPSPTTCACGGCTSSSSSRLPAASGSGG